MSSQVQYIQSLILSVRSQLNQIERAVAFHSEVPMIGMAPSMDAIIYAVSNAYGVPVENFTVHSRRKQMVKPRHVAFYLCSTLNGASLPEIGRKFKMHHTTVLHGIRKVTAQRTTDCELDQLLTLLATRLSPKRPLEYPQEDNKNLALSTTFPTQ